MNGDIVKVGGKIIGRIVGGVFYKPVRGSIDMLHTPRAWCIDMEAFERQIRPKADRIVITDEDDGAEYHATVAYFDRHKREVSRRWGRQYVLGFERWRNSADEQLGLFGDD